MRFRTTRRILAINGSTSLSIGRAMTLWSLAACAVLTCVAADAMAQTVTVEGGISGRAGADRKPGGNPADAIVVGPEEFRRAEVAVRRKILAGWEAVAKIEDRAILPLLESALPDPDRIVRLHAFRTLLKIENAANFGRLKKQTVSVDPSSRPSLLNAILELLKHADAETRGNGATLLLVHEHPLSRRSELALLDALTAERNPMAKAKMLMVLGPAAGGGSDAARAQIVAALNETEHTTVKAQALLLSGRFSILEALPQAVNALSSEDKGVRLAAASSLLATRANVATYCAEFTARLAGESDAEIKAKLRQLAALRCP